MGRNDGLPNTLVMYSVAVRQRQAGTVCSSLLLPIFRAQQLAQATADEPTESEGESRSQQTEQDLPSPRFEQ